MYKKIVEYDSKQFILYVFETRKEHLIKCSRDEIIHSIERNTPYHTKFFRNMIGLIN
ncbi:hypothetical protein JDS87_28480 [Bacillus cereus]|uniref:hypothetical protein n=1 Tax=Bacillus cereus TaxID=1396 RepID=UPI0018F2E8F9|nr:hypothetical protein [Bacillus cereus]MBJ8055736.1 hypothetical protein [Bacillus cereus]